MGKSTTIIIINNKINYSTLHNRIRNIVNIIMKNCRVRISSCLICPELLREPPRAKVEEDRLVNLMLRSNSYGLQGYKVEKITFPGGTGIIVARGIKENKVQGKENWTHGNKSKTQENNLMKTNFSCFELNKIPVRFLLLRN